MKNYQEPIKSHHIGCVCCGGNNNILNKETVLYQGFGGYHVTKNGKLFYMADCNDENPIKVSNLNIPDNTRSDWRIELSLPLIGGTWQWQNNELVLIDENIGFA